MSRYKNTASVYVPVAASGETCCPIGQTNTKRVLSLCNAQFPKFSPSQTLDRKRGHIH